jgi:hypothetical protein
MCSLKLFLGTGHPEGLLYSLTFPAIRAKPLKDRAVSVDKKRCFFGCPHIQLAVVGQGEVADSLAIGAQKMVMRVKTVIETINMRQLYLEDFALLYQNIQITVNGTAADFIVYGADIQINLIRAWMVAAGPDRVQNQLALSGVSMLLHNRTLPVFDNRLH